MMSGDNTKECFDLYLEALDLRDQVLELQKKKENQSISELEMERLIELEKQLRQVIQLGRALSG